MLVSVYIIQFLSDIRGLWGDSHHIPTIRTMLLRDMKGEGNLLYPHEVFLYFTT